MIFATLLRIMAGSKQPFDTVGSNSKMILSSFPFLFFFPLLPYFLSRTFSNSLFSHLYTYIYTSFLSLSLSLPTLAELFSLFIFSHFSLSHSPSLFGQPTPATAGTAIYTRPADSEAVRRNKSRLLYKCCQQNRNIAFAYQLFAVQFTRAGGGRQETGGFRERWRPGGKGFWAGWELTIHVGRGGGVHSLLVHVANKLATAASLLRPFATSCLPSRNGRLPFALPPVLLLAQSKYFHPYILKMSRGRFMGSRWGSGTGATLPTSRGTPSGYKLILFFSRRGGYLLGYIAPLPRRGRGAANEEDQSHRRVVLVRFRFDFQRNEIYLLSFVYLELLLAKA